MGKQICVVGLGYIGLPTASLLAAKGFAVLGVDINPGIVQTINSGKIHIHEPGLEVLVRAATLSGNLRADISPAIADVFIIAVPTPFKANHEPDLAYVESSVRSIAPFVRNGDLVILESTSPVGTTEKIGRWLSEYRPDLNIPSGLSQVVAARAEQLMIAHCPERVLPGQILKELVENGRIVGGVDAISTTAATEFYRSFVSGEVIATSSRCAEFCKLVENSYRDVNIAFANELALVSESLGIDVWELIELANHHPRVNILQPGPGVGGHCIAVDPWFIVHSAPDEARLIKTAREVNDSRPHAIVESVKQLARSRKAKTIGCLGLSYKANIDDLRESPALAITARIARELAVNVLVTEPHIERLPEVLSELPNVTLVDLDASLAESDLVVLLVDHLVFRTIDPSRLRGKEWIDTRGIWETHRVAH